MRINILGVWFDPVSMDQAVSAALVRLKEKSGGYICTPNPEIVWAARQNPALAEAISEAALVLPDGVGVLRAAKLLGTPLPERVTGCDFCQNLLPQFVGRLYLLGGKPGVAELAAARVSRDYPGIIVCGCADGYFDCTDEAIKTAAESNPDLMLVCLGAPKQELFMQYAADKMPHTLMAGLGGTIDILAGTEKRAPVFWQQMQLEWLYRLLRHPGRIGRQVNLMRFILAVHRETKNRNS